MIINLTEEIDDVWVERERSLDAVRVCCLVLLSCVLCLTLGSCSDETGGVVSSGGVDAGTTLNVEADIYSFSLAKGLFGGISLEGAVLTPDEEAAEAYYGKPVSSRAIVFHREVSNPGADGIRAALAKP